MQNKSFISYSFEIIMCQYETSKINIEIYFYMCQNQINTHITAYFQRVKVNSI